MKQKIIAKESMLIEGYHLINFGISIRRNTETYWETSNILSWQTINM